MMNNSDSLKKNMAESFELESKIPDRQSADEKIQDAEIIWSGDCSVCCKKLKHYPAFSRNGTTVTVHSFAIIMGEEEEETEPVGYLEDLYEDYRRRKMVKVRWFNRSEEMISSGLIIPEHELIMTPEVQVVSAECVNGIATVLSPKHYEQCLSVLSQDFSDGIFMCSRQIKKNNKIVSFPLPKLHGYSNQTIFSILNPPNLLNQQVSSDKQGKKEEVQACVTTACLVEEEPSQEIMKIKASVCSEVHCFGVGDEIEVLCEDSGIRGCWYRCKILKVTEKRLRVIYKDVEDAGGPGNIMEWVYTYKVAAPDKLGMRCLGRYTIRPFPTTSSVDDCYSIGSVVDAWWCDGWWEGIVVTKNVCGDGTFCVYFPDENRNENFEEEQLRSSKEWVDNKWVQVDPKPELLIIVSLLLKSSSSSNVKSALDDGGGGSSEAEKGGMRSGCN